ncbi:FolC bifunctional protein [Leucogyrophana mollusca]|uniref:FolC bifunctional protein n=1 Tax=Leucogyrophana mollusca TaxID=85980 RepID=A0ACB8C0U9_9AGAM|nr:FolC bifunctional protein [Leucogyrophana mollusca]
MSTETRTYREAVECLNTLQSNAATLEAVRAAGVRLNPNAIPEMIEYLQRIGYEPDHLNQLNVIHITGTKGKGSTSALTDSILRHVKPGWKVGLYTSPHLVAVRERIRINGKPISEEDFAKYFFEVWDRLKANDVRKDPDTTPSMPGYFRYMTLLAYHTFLRLKVDATILEVGIGGHSDSTNIVPKPVVAGVTALGLDHTSVLGKTLSDIAWQKGGIYKEGVPALTVNQPKEGMEVLTERAATLKASEFKVVSLLPGLSSIKLGLAGEHQVQNATLAVEMARIFLSAQGAIPAVTEPLPEAFVRGLENTKWPGRCQTVADPDPAHGSTTWYLDGAHTIESLDYCIQWFVHPGVGIPSASTATSERPLRVLVFNCTNGRSGTSFLGSVLAKTSAQLALYGSTETAEAFFDHAIFCNNVTYADGGFKSDLNSVGMSDADLKHLKTQKELAEAWKELVPAFPGESVHVLASIEDAVKIIRKLSPADRPASVLVTGSLHLVGGTIEVAGLSSVAL